MIIAPTIDIRKCLVDNGGKELVDLYREAALELSRREWCRGRYMTMTGGACVLAALDIALRDEPNYGAWITASDLLWRYLSHNGQLDIPTVARWNDEHCESKAEAIAALEGCADWLEEML